MKIQAIKLTMMKNQAININLLIRFWIVWITDQGSFFFSNKFADFIIVYLQHKNLYNKFHASIHVAKIFS